MLKIAIAKTAQQIDEVLKLRYQEFTDSRSTSSKPDSSKPDSNELGRLIDRFDTFPSTTHLVAIDNNTVVGGLRLTFDGNGGMPLDDWTNIRKALPSQSKVLCCDLHCITPVSEGKACNHCSESIYTTMGMLLVASYFAISKDLTHIVALVSVEIADRLEFIGFRRVKGQTNEENEGNSEESAAKKTAAKKTALVPLVLDIKNDLDDSFVQFSQENELQGLIHAYGCALYQPGEAILRAGATGNCAFVIGAGEVDVRHPGSEEIIDTMGAGEVFGELALLTDQVRSADIIAKTEVRAMILEKSVFVDYLTEEPKVALKLLESMGYRMKHLIDYCNAQTASV